MKARKDAKQRQKVQLGQLEEVRRLHPATDFKDGHMTLGFRVDLKDGEEIVLLISDGKTATSEVLCAPAQRQDSSDNGLELAGKPYVLSGNGTPPMLQDFWTLENVNAFLGNPTRPSALYVQIKDALRRFLDLSEPVYGLLAAWIVMTYFAHLFNAVPSLHFIGPKETGKSKTLEALRFTCFNAWKGRDISAAALGDTVEGQRGTVLIDQAEKLDEKNDGNINLVGLLADSYKKAGGNRRIVELTKKTGRKVLEFSTFGSKAFASTKHIDPDLRDRCIRIPMIRTRLLLPNLEGYEPEWLDLRDSLYRFTLLAFQEVETAYKAIMGDGTRATELWLPLAAVLSVLEVEGKEVQVIREYFLNQSRESRHEPSGWELLLLEAIKSKAQNQGDEFTLTPSEIVNVTGFTEEDVKKPGSKLVGDILSSYNLYQKKSRPRGEDGKRLVAYHFNPSRVNDLCSRYLRLDGQDHEKGEHFNGDTTSNDASTSTMKNNHTNIKFLTSTQEDSGTCSHVYQEAQEEQVEHDEKCTTKNACTIHHFENITESENGTKGHEDMQGVAGKKSHLWEGII